MGLVFALLLALVHGAWAPLDELDRAVADALNSRVAGSRPMVNLLKGVTDFGGRTVLTLVLLVGATYLLIRRQPRRPCTWLPLPAAPSCSIRSSSCSLNGSGRSSRCPWPRRPARASPAATPSARWSPMVCCCWSSYLPCAGDGGRARSPSWRCLSS